MSFGSDLADLYRGCGIHARKVLEGARIGELPIERPTRFALVVNAKTAKALGLTIPPSLMLRASEVIDQ